MHVHFIAPERYLRASHEIIRHGRLNGTAKTLLLWSLSLPPGSRETVMSIGGRMPEGRTAVSRARGQLIGEGFLHVRRSQHPTKGTWRTELMVTSVPLTDPQEIAAAWGGAETARTAAPADRIPAVGAPAGRVVGTSPMGGNKKGNTSLPEPPPPTAPCAPDAAPDVAADAVPDVAAARLLCGLGGRDRRLRLGLSEALALAPLVNRWLALDPDTQRLQEALLDGLPPRVHVPAAFLRDRLTRKLPAAAEPVPPSPLGHECGHCRAPIPAPGDCPPCAGRPGAATGPAPDVVARNRRGAARARELMRAARAA